MEQLKQWLSTFERPKILDVGCGVGNFIYLLLEVAKNDPVIVGIDTSAGAVAVARKQFADHPEVSFVEGDVTAYPFEAASFDIVCLSNTLHHLKDPVAVFAAMRRLLKKGGALLVNEMVSNGLTEAQKSHRKVHHLAAEIDRAMGVYHAPTYAKDVYLAKLKRLTGETPVLVWDIRFDEGPKPTEEEINQMASTVDRLLSRVPEGDVKRKLVAKGQRIKRHIQKHSYAGATQVAAVIVF